MLADKSEKNYKNMKLEKSIKNIESSAKISRATFSVTVVPEHGRDTTRGGGGRIPARLQEDGENASEPPRRFPDRSSAALGRAPLSPDRDATSDCARRPNEDDEKPPPHQALFGFAGPNIQGTAVGRPSRNDKPVAEVKPTTSVVHAQEKRRSVGSHFQKKRDKQQSEIGPNFTPFNDPQKALQLTSVQINSPEWELAVTGLQNISRLSMFHGRELRPNSLQPFARPVAKHIKSLRSQVARAACTAMQKMFSFVPKSAEPDVEEIASALFPRTADTNKFLRVQSTEALNSMVDNVNPVKCVHVITSKGIKHGNRLVRAEACQLLARVVDKLGVGGTLNLPVDSRDAVITAATNMVFDNTPTSRQAAQRILAKLSTDPRGAALISSVASPNVKATLNKSLSKIFLK